MRVPSAVFEALGSPIFLCVLGSRITFNLREAADHGINRGTNWSSYTHSTIQFAGPVPQGETTYVPRLILSKTSSLHDSPLF